MAAKKATKVEEPAVEPVSPVAVGDVFGGWRVVEVFTDEDGAERVRVVSEANPLISSTPLAADLSAF